MNHRLHNAMLAPSTYTHKVDEVEFRQTHISRVYLAGDRVYKIKKAVNFGFLDFSSLKKRLHFCQEELRLNRRFCPDHYLEVAALCQEAGRIKIGGPGKVLEYAVVMRRLPEHLMLSHLIDQKTPGLDRRMEELARHLAQLHRGAPVIHEAPKEDDVRRMCLNWEENFTQVTPFVGELLPSPCLNAAHLYVEKMFQDRRSWLRQRQLEGFVRENHGDLHTQHICLSTPFCIYDCIEFNREFRISDTASDLAFLLMDLEFNERFDLARRLLESYIEATQDLGLQALLPFYKLYRAFVRGKVEALLFSSTDASEQLREQAAKRARSYFALAASYLVPPTMILLCGRMGVGKSTLGSALTQKLSSIIIRSDVLRKELIAMPPGQSCHDPFGEGIYSPGNSERIYEELLKRSREHLSLGRSVIIDASFCRRNHRESFRQAAQQLGVPCLTLHIDCPDQIALERLQRRQAQGLDPSDGRAELLKSQTALFETPDSEPGVLPVDSSLGIEYNSNLVLSEVLERFQWP